MKLTSIIFLTACLSANAVGYSQTITLSLKNVKVQKVFKEVSRQTGVSIIYDESLFNDFSLVSIQVKNASISEVLTKCLKNQPFTFDLEGNAIIIQRKNITARDFPFNVTSPVQQPVEIKGRVLNEQGQPLANVNIIVKETKIGTVSDNEGRFEIVAQPGNTLVFSIVGYQSQEVKVGTDNTIAITLKTLVGALHDVVVIGYGSTTRKDLTGSISSVPSTVFENPSFGDVGYAIQGQVSGVNILTGDGSPGEQVRINIRGMGSLLGNTSPLIVVDGVPMPSEFNLSDLNPNDIQAIDVLKGASSSAIYGSRAASGVVIITTKAGRRNETPKITYSFNQGFDELTSDIDVLSGEEFKYMLFEGALNAARFNGLSNMSGYVQYQAYLQPGYFKEHETNWMAEMLQNSTFQSHNLSIRGGSNNSAYSVSLGYNNDQGMLLQSGYKRYNINAAINTDISKKVKFGLDFKGNIAQRDIATETLHGVTKGRPDILAYNADGSVHMNTYLQNGNGQRLLIESPLANLLENSNVLKSKTANFSAFLQINFLPGFNFKSRYNYYDFQSNSKQYYSSTTTAGSGFGFIRAGRLYDANNYSLQGEFENSVNYSKRITEDHTVDAVLATTFLSEDKKYNRLWFDNFPDNSIQTQFYQGASFQQASGYHYKGYMVSYLGRVNYKFKDRYLLTGSFRRDGSSKFSANNAYGNFPAVAAAYIISNEKFLRDIKWIDQIKVRASAGKTGMADVGYYNWRTTYEATNYANASAVIPIQVGNENLRWESTKQTDIGFEYSLFNSRLRGGIVYYTKNTDGLLYPFTMAPSSSYNRATVNFAEISNKGFDIDLEVGIIQKNDISWSLGINYNNNKNRVEKLDKDYITSTDGSQVLRSTIIKEGYPVGLIYGFKTNGIYNSQKQLDDDRAAALASGTGRAFAPDMFLGEIRYVDLNGDGYVDMTTVIGNADRTVLGNALPDFSGGFNTNFQFRQWSLSAFGTYSYGNDKVWSQELFQFGTNQAQPTNVWRIALKRWTPENPDSRYPAFRNSRGIPATRFNDFSVHDASFLKIQRVSIAYNFSENLIKKLRIINGLNIHASVNNVHIFTKYPGPNPEGYSLNNIEGAALDYATFPGNRTYNFGINVSF